MSVLSELLRLKTYREGKAEMAVAGCRHMLAEAADQASRAHRSLDEYRDWRDREERRMYAGVCARIVRLRELEWLREDVAELHRREIGLETALSEAQYRREESEQALRDARQIHELARRVREKFVQLASAHSDELRDEQQRSEERETEELYSIRRERDEWEQEDG